MNSVDEILKMKRADDIGHLHDLIGQTVTRCNKIDARLDSLTTLVEDIDHALTALAVETARLSDALGAETKTRAQFNRDQQLMDLEIHHARIRGDY